MKKSLVKKFFMLGSMLLASQASAAVYRPGLTQVYYSFSGSVEAPKYDDLSADNAAFSTRDRTPGVISGTKANCNGFTNPWSGVKHSWGNYHAYGYQGQIWLEKDTTYQIWGAFDDGSALYIGNTKVFSTGNTSAYGTSPTQRSYTAPYTGWHDMQAYVWDWGGGRSSNLACVDALQWNTTGTTGNYGDSSVWNRFICNNDFQFLRTVTGEEFMVASVDSVSGDDVTFNFVFTDVPAEATLKAYLGSQDAGASDTGWTAVATLGTVNAGSSEVSYIVEDANNYQVIRFCLSNAQSNNDDAFEDWTDLMLTGLTPSIRLSSISSISTSSAMLSATLAENGGDEIVVKFLLSDSDKGHNLEDWTVAAQLDAVSGEYSATVEGLESDSIYYASVYADNATGRYGWNEGDNIPFLTSAIAISSTVNQFYESDNSSFVVTVSRGIEAPFETIVELDSAFTGSDGKVVGLPQSVTIPANASSVSFNLSTTDNDEEDGDAVLSIWTKGGLYAPCESPAQITIIDDESATGGPCYWTGLGDGTSWNDGENWSIHAIPTVVHDVIIDSALGSGTITIEDGTTTTKIRSIRFEAPSGTISGGTISVQDAVTMNSGKLYSSIATTAPWIKDADGTLAIYGNERTSTGNFTIEAGTVESRNNNALPAGVIYVGTGVDTGTRVWLRYYNDVKSVVHVRTDGGFSAQSNGTHITSKIYFYGNAYSNGKYTYWERNVYLADGAKFYSDGSGWQGPMYGASWNEMGIGTKASDVPCILTTTRNVNGYYNGNVLMTERGTAPVDLIVTAGGINATDSTKTYSKTGAGIVQLIGNNRLTSNNKKIFTFAINGGGVYADGPRDGNVINNANISLASGAFLGGTGTVCNAVAGTTKLTMAGSSTLKPGTLDAYTGVFSSGTLALGSATRNTELALSSGSKVEIAATRNGVSSLEVYGPIDLSASNTKLVVNADIDNLPRSGTYPLVVSKVATVTTTTTGDEGETTTSESFGGQITGTFATVENSFRGSKIIYETDGVYLEYRPATFIVIY